MRRVDRIGWLVLVLIGWSCWQCSVASAQGRRFSGREDSSENVTLTTRDGVKLKATYYPSALGRKAVPIVMLHDYKESRKVFNGLANVLQNPPSEEVPSHAILTVDLRGHGGSTTAAAPNGRTRELDAARLGKQDFRNMVLYDMEAVRKFLVKKNDAGQLNLNKLCLLGSGMGANIGTAWAAVDWSAQPLAQRKQGQDVKGLILSSPEWSFRGVPMLQPLKHPGVREKISVMLVYGAQDRKSAKSAENVYKNLERYHPEPPPEQRREKQDLFKIALPTSLKGTRLLTDRDFRMLPRIAQFLEARLSNQDYEWSRRLSSN